MTSEVILTDKRVPIHLKSCYNSDRLSCNGRRWSEVMLGKLKRRNAISISLPFQAGRNTIKSNNYRHKMWMDFCLLDCVRLGRCVRVSTIVLQDSSSFYYSFRAFHMLCARVEEYTLKRRDLTPVADVTKTMRLLHLCSFHCNLQGSVILRL